MEFTYILKNILILNGFSQKEFAKIIGVKQSQVSEWLKGKAKPGYDSLKAMVLNLPNVTANELLGLEDETGAKYINSFNNINNQNGEMNIK